MPSQWSRQRLWNGAIVTRQLPARDAVLKLLEGRAIEVTICPSEVARNLSATDWRDAMPTVHAAVDKLLDEGLIRLSWKGKPLTTRSGPYRICRTG